MHRAIHSLEVILLAGSNDVALLISLLVDKHRREHGAGVVGQVTRGVEQPSFSDLRSVNEVEPSLHMTSDDVFLNKMTQHRALRVEHHEARADFLREGEQIELSSQLAVVATLGFLDPLLVSRQVLTAGPGCSVDALQLVVGLVTLPVRGRELCQGEGISQVFGRGHVGAAAQIFPCYLAITTHIVVDRQLATANFDRGALSTLTLGANELQLVRLVGQLLASGLLSSDPTHEALILFDDSLHPLLELRKNLGGDGLNIAEVIVEPVGNERTNTQVHLGVQLLDGLSHDVGGRVSDDIEPVLTGGLNRLHLGAVMEFTLQIDEVAVDPHGNDGTVGTEEIQSGGRSVHLLGPGGTGTVQGDADGHD